MVLHCVLHERRDALVAFSSAEFQGPINFVIKVNSCAQFRQVSFAIILASKHLCIKLGDASFQPKGPTFRQVLLAGALGNKLAGAEGFHPENEERGAHDEAVDQKQRVVFGADEDDGCYVQYG